MSESPLLRWLQAPPIIDSFLALDSSRMEDVFFPATYSLNLILTDYVATLEIDGVSRALAPGHLMLIPPACTRRYRFERHGLHRYVRFTIGNDTPPDLSFGHWDGGAFARRFQQAFDLARSLFPTAPARSRAIAWEMLWHLPELPVLAGEHGFVAHPVVREAQQRLEAELSRPPSIAQLAQQLGLTPTHLTRLFRRELGLTPHAYLRARRKTLFEELLRHTPIPIVEVARQLGYDDLHHFNRTVRHYFGCGPRALRSHLSAPTSSTRICASRHSTRNRLADDVDRPRPDCKCGRG